MGIGNQIGVWLSPTPAMLMKLKASSMAIIVLKRAWRGDHWQNMRQPVYSINQDPGNRASQPHDHYPTLKMTHLAFKSGLFNIGLMR
ncbi:hypothetical protein [Escherichia coli]|uniref:hypothetical protein n=1 Tax=Escherichia coli TaxID=562 RepID=UPI003BF6B634